MKKMFIFTNYKNWEKAVQALSFLEFRDRGFVRELQLIDECKHETGSL